MIVDEVEVPDSRKMVQRSSKNRVTNNPFGEASMVGSVADKLVYGPQFRGRLSGRVSYLRRSW